MDNRVSDELNLDELEKIVGGKPSASGASQAEAQLSRLACSNCGEICMVDLRKSSYKCPACRMVNQISG